MPKFLCKLVQGHFGDTDLGLKLKIDKFQSGCTILHPLTSGDNECFYNGLYRYCCTIVWKIPLKAVCMHTTIVRGHRQWPPSYKLKILTFQCIPLLTVEEFK